MNPSFKIKASHTSICEAFIFNSFESKSIVQRAKLIYLDHLANYIFTKQPKGIVLNLNNSHGYVVFDEPTLLPNEKYLPIDLLSPKAKKRSR